MSLREGLTYICVVQNRREEPVEEEEAHEHVDLGPPWHDERASDVCDLGPVKSENAHTKS